MNKRLLWIPVGIIVVGFILNSIIKGCNDSEPGSVFTAEVPNSKVAVDKSNLKALDLYIDFSGSMRGYIDFSKLSDGANAKSDMKSTVTTFLDKVEAIFSIKSANHCGDKVYDKNVFRKALQDESIFNSGTTLLHDMIEKNCANANDSTVKVIVSDMVLSFGKQKLLSSNDPYYNKNHLDDLSGTIHTAMTNIHSKGLDVVFLQYYSDYNGNYYCNFAENLRGGDAHKGKLMRERPYYILLVGKEIILKSILAEDCLRDAVNVYASFGINSSDKKTVPYVIKQDDSTNFWTQGSDSNLKGAFWTSSNWGDDKTKFHINCSDFKIPSYLNKNSLSGRCSEGSVNNINYDDGRGNISFILETKPFNQLDKNTNVSVEIVSTNNWKNDASIKDEDDVDKEAKELEGRTWGLNYIVDAMDNAFHGKKYSEGEVVGIFSFNLIKK